MVTEQDSRAPGRPGDTRERILAAAAQILGEEGLAARLSVRKVADRAQVSTGSLRHHFPTQQGLREEVVHRIYEWMTPAGDIHETTVPPRDRLVGCLRGVMSAAEAGKPARDAMITLTETFIAAEQTVEVRDSYLAMEQDGQRRVEGWLRVLVDEGHILRCDVFSAARFLGTVTEGLMLKRALPVDDAIVAIEDEILYMAADAVLE